MGQIKLFEWYPGPPSVQGFSIEAFVLSSFSCIVFSSFFRRQWVHFSSYGGPPFRSEVFFVVIDASHYRSSGRPPQLADSVCLLGVSTGVEPKGVREHTLPALPCKECFSSLYFG